jgi:Bacterial transcriptional repressor
VAEQILGGLVKAGQMRASPAEIATLAENMVLIASYWMSFEFARDPRAVQDGRTLARGAFHVISLAAPYLEPHERELFDQLAKRYIA